MIFDGGIRYVVGQNRFYDVSRNGKRFLLIESPNTGTQVEAAELRVVLNWAEELKRLLPAQP